jgi:Family of unknown function (DUF6314)
VDFPEEIFQVSDLKAFLEGEWDLERRLDDRRAGELGRFEGQAVFFADDELLLYREDGRLIMGDHSGPALQLYTYAFPEKGRAAVDFRDGGRFHDLDLTTGQWTATHLCAPDRYDGAFAALGPDAWRVVWRVTGPRKDLILDSSYRRRL